MGFRKIGGKRKVGKLERGAALGFRRFLVIGPWFHFCELFFGSFHFGLRKRVFCRRKQDHKPLKVITEREKRMSTKLKCFQVFLAYFLINLLAASSGHNIWRKPGCHKVGHTRKVSIPDCVEFHITTNACRGFCESWSVPSGMETLRVNPFQLITSVGQCCNIMDTEDVEVKVMCLDGTRELTFKSAKSCSCYHCKKD